MMMLNLSVGTYDPITKKIGVTYTGDRTEMGKMP